MPPYRNAYDRLCDKIDDVAQMDRIWAIGFSMGHMHGQRWMEALRHDGNFPKEPRSIYKRLQKHYEKRLKKMK